MSVGFVDAETRSEVNLVTDGADKYLKNHETLIWTYAVDNDPVQCWDVLHHKAPRYFLDMLRDPTLPLVAHNAPFDRGSLSFSKNCHLKTPPSRWRCTRAQAYAHGLPGSLELLGIVLGLPPEDQKQAEAGHRLIDVFCKMYASSYATPEQRPVEWEEFKCYAVQDTATLREIYKRLPTHNYQTGNLEMWQIDQFINERGFGFDQPLAWAAIELLEKSKNRNDAVVSQATRGEVGAATQRGKLLAWLAKHYEAEIKDLKAATVRDMLEQDDIEPRMRLLLESRLDAAKSSGAKFKRGVKLVGVRDRMRNAIQFCGAGRTGRDSHKGFQPGNMKRPMIDELIDGKFKSRPVKAKYIDEILIPGIYSGDALDCPEVFFKPNETCALALRHTIIAAPGNELIVADYSNIESRVLAWLAGETWKLAAYREGKDLYKILYALFFGGREEDVDDNQRQAAKVVELSMGFGGGVGAYIPMSQTYNIDLSALPAMVLPNAAPKRLKKAERAWRVAFLEGNDFGVDADVYMACDVLKQAYRESNEAINQLRHDVDAAVKAAVREPGTSYRVAKCTIWCSNTALLIGLPNGDRLVYYQPKLHTKTYRDPITGKESQREHVSYNTARGKSWRRENAWGGLFVENIVQAVANRLLRDGVRAVHRDTLQVPAIKAYLDTLPEEERTSIVLKVHDEVVLDVPVGSYTLERLIELLIGSSAWARGMPIAAAGWKGPRYGKR